MNRREMLSVIGAAITFLDYNRVDAAIAQRRAVPQQYNEFPPMIPGFLVQVKTTVTAPDARTVEEAREAAAMFLWMRLVERFIDPKTKVASFVRMRESFLRDVKSWSSV